MQSTKKPGGALETECTISQNTVAYSEATAPSRIDTDTIFVFNPCASVSIRGSYSSTASHGGGSDQSRARQQAVSGYVGELPKWPTKSGEMTAPSGRWDRLQSAAGFGPSRTTSATAPRTTAAMGWGASISSASCRRARGGRLGEIG